METYRSIYEAAGYEVKFISAIDETGVEEVRKILRGKTSVLAGPSGVGKSSLTNCIQPRAAMETGDISRKIERGKHTTRHSQLFYVEEKMCIRDSLPGGVQDGLPFLRIHPGWAGAEPEAFGNAGPDLPDTGPYRLSLIHISSAGWKMKTMPCGCRIISRWSRWTYPAGWEGALMNLPLSRDGSSSFRASTHLTVFSSVCSDAPEGGSCAAGSGMERDM